MSKEMPVWKQTARDKFLELYRKYKNEHHEKSDEVIADEIGIPLSTMKYTLNGKGFEDLRCKNKPWTGHLLTAYFCVYCMLA